MNRALLITVGICIILLVVGVWVFLLIFGTPSTPQEVFSDLGIIETPTPLPEGGFAPLPEASTTVVDVSATSLQQLTTMPVAGFMVATSGPATTVRFIERGTGHAYNINLTTGIQTVLANITTPLTTKAIWSPDGTRAILTTDTTTPSHHLLTLTNEPTLTSAFLPTDAENIQFLDATTIAYTRSNVVQTILYTHNLLTETATETLIIGFPQAVVVWHDTTWFVAPKPTALLEGALYTASSNTLIPRTEAALGLLPLFSKAGVFINSITDGVYSATMLDTATEIGSFMLPEKCAARTVSEIWCANDDILPDGEYLEQWYKGVVVSDDAVYRISTTEQSITSQFVPERLVGRPLDIMAPQFNIDGSNLLFSHRADNTLWLYQDTAVTQSGD